MIRVLVLFCSALQAAPLQSPVNQVFQFTFSSTWSPWADGAKTSAAAYLWIPEKCKRLRGLLIMGSNVPEHMLVGHRAIREVCAKNDLGIVWSTPTFLYYKAKNEDKTIVAFLQQLLDGLARTSGYAEVAIVPWLPMGESGHLLMVDALVEAAPERCIAGIWIKNAHLPPKNRTVPALVVFGTAQEWGQDKVDIRTRWNTFSAYENVQKQRKQNPDWPLSLLIDGGSGHFDCAEWLVQYFARYIDQVVKARVAKSGLRPVDMKKGVVADLPVPGHEKGKTAPWYFDKASARQAQSIARINWKAESQLPAFADSSGAIAAFDFNGISSITPQMEEDGISFRMQAVMLDKIPGNFSNAGEPLATATGNPLIEWLCGPLAPLGDGRFRVALDRTYPHHPIYLAARQVGTDKIREAVQPLAIKLKRNEEGKQQTIRFEKISDVKVGSAPVKLNATSDSGLPVGYFVLAGPAIVEDGTLYFTGIPPRAKYPVEVTVAAWQWGRSAEPKVKTAQIVKQSFQIHRQ